MSNKIDSNVTGLRFAEEESLKVLPTTPLWYLLEPNSYSDFGGQVATIARRPINPSRQRKKGVATDLDASGGFNQDLTFSNMTRLLQGFFFASIREKKTTAPMNAAAIPITSVGVNAYNAAAGLTGVLQGHLLWASKFGLSANNGLKTSSGASTATAISVTDTLVVEASPPAAAKVEVVGYQFASATLDIAMSGDLVRLTRVSGAVDLTTLGLIPGEWVYVGGDAASVGFANNGGFARVHLIAATYIELDKVDWNPVGEVGTAKTIRIFFGSVLKNESDPSLITRRTYNIERTLGSDADGVMSEYLVGAVANEFTLNIGQATKVTTDVTFIALDNEQRNGDTGVKNGTRIPSPLESEYNTSNDFSRIKLAVVGDGAAPTPLFAFATDMTLSVNNNVTPNKAIAVFGAFDTSAGTFEVGGNITVYFASIEAVQAVRNSEDITLDIALVKGNSGLLMDIPLLGLGDGRLNVVQDQAITLPLSLEAGESAFGHTFLLNSFAYLPDVAG